MPRPAPTDPGTCFSASQIDASRSFAKRRRRRGVAGLVADVGLLGWFALTRPGRRMASAIFESAGAAAPALAAPALAASVVAARDLVAFPFALASRREDVRERLSAQSLIAWLGDQAKGMGIGGLLQVAPVGALVTLAARSPRRFAAVGASGAAGLVIALSALGPVVLEPVFNRFAPLPDGPVRRRLLELAAGMGVPVRDVLVADASRRTTRLNAYVSGLGRTRRVVVFDTLLATAGEPDAGPVGGTLAQPDVDPDGGTSGDPGRNPAREPAGADELAMVCAHELAHARHRDVAKGTAAGAAMAAISVLAVRRLAERQLVRRLLGADGLGDPRVIPGLFLGMRLASVGLAPAGAFWSRRIEARADWTALEATDDPAAAVALERRLALTNRADLRPGRLATIWFATHPSTMARIAQALLFAERRGIPVTVRSSSGADGRADGGERTADA